MQDTNRADEKFEALGRVAGSLAHDFNNLLHVISMNLELVSMYAKDEKVTPVLDRAKTAARKGARLTAQLLTFARTDSTGARALELNAHLQGMSELLQVCAGSAIEVEVAPANGAARVLVDPVQLSLALVGLAGDTRDALPEGGRLRISAEPAENGVALRCTDTRNGAGVLPREAAALVVATGGSAQSVQEADGAFSWLIVLPAAPAETGAEAPAALSAH